MRKRLAGAILGVVVALATVGFSATTAGPAGAAVGGPVIIGGDDLNDHGSYDATNDVNQAGWLYIQRALENIRPRVGRANDGSVAALGSASSTATSGDAGGAIFHGAEEAGLPVTFHDGGTAMEAFFDAIRNGTARPMIISIPGDGASNGIDTQEEVDALTANAQTLADFVNQGGGLLSHGSEFGWLTALLPGVTTVDGGSSGDLEMTPAGSNAFPGVTNADVNAGPWHNHFEGDFGGLEVLVESNQVTTSDGRRAPVVLGGASVILPGSITPYAMVAADGGVFAPAGEGFVGTAALRPDVIKRNPDGTIVAPSEDALVAPVMGIAYTPDRKGAWMVMANGDVLEIGNAPDLGDLLGVNLEAPISGIVATPDGTGLYLVGFDGGVFALGTAPWLGSLPADGVVPQGVIVGIALDPDGRGYILVGEDGGVFAYQAAWVGSASAGDSAFAISGIAADPDGRGYLLTAIDGGVFAYEATFSGSAVGLPLEGPILGIAANGNGRGYWLAGADGGVFAFGGAPFTGSVAHLLLNAPIVGIVAL